ncbi:hypothetical protein KCU83_g178, partial [Aureobasidium melanogenum]
MRFRGSFCNSLRNKSRSKSSNSSYASSYSDLFPEAAGGKSQTPLGYVDFFVSNAPHDNEFIVDKWRAAKEHTKQSDTESPYIDSRSHWRGLANPISVLGNLVIVDGTTEIRNAEVRDLCPVISYTIGMEVLSTKRTHATRQAWRTCFFFLSQSFPLLFETPRFGLVKDGTILSLSFLVVENATRLSDIAAALNQSNLLRSARTPYNLAKVDTF